MGRMMWRRQVLAGACALPGLAVFAARATGGEGTVETGNADVIRSYYAAWENKDWGPFDRVLADDFTFTSPNDDDHISKSAFKTRCWDTQIDFIKRFDLEQLMVRGGDGLVKYLCHTKNGKTFRNVEYLRVADGRIKSIECYFGARSSFASRVSNG